MESSANELTLGECPTELFVPTGDDGALLL